MKKERVNKSGKGGQLDKKDIWKRQRNNADNLGRGGGGD